jgi:ribosomal protein L11 methyltransferase
MAEIFAALLGSRAVALTIISPPRKSEARIEALFDGEPDWAALNASVAVMAMVQGIKLPKLEVTEVENLDWLKKLAADFPPLSIARWTIHGAHHKGRIPNPRMALQIDATSAFGTGEHPTTRGCLLMLNVLLKKKKIRRGRMLDVGCGSGILAMAYVKATHGHAIGIDLDTDSVGIAVKNAHVNGMQKHVRLKTGRGYTSRLVQQNAPYDLIMANIFARPLSHMAKDLKRSLRPGGIGILSGMLMSQANQVLAAHHMQNLHLMQRICIGEWSVLAFQRRTKA